MSELNEKVEAIINYINSETKGMGNNERAMVLLLVMELSKCAVDIDIIDTYKQSKREDGGDD